MWDVLNQGAQGRALQSQRTVNAKASLWHPVSSIIKMRLSCQKLCECITLGSTFCGEILVEGLQAVLGSTLEKHPLTFSFLLIAI